MAGQVPNVCAGPFGAFYDFYIERPWLMRAIGRTVWGINASVLYEAMKPIEEAEPGAAIADVPCGGGVAFRALSPDKEVRYVAADLCPKMLRRAQGRAARRSLRQVETVRANMVELPFAAEEFDLFLSFSGLHMIPKPEQAVAEIARCLKPGGKVVGTTFLSDGSRRARALFKAGSYRGHALPPDRASLIGQLKQAGLNAVHLGPQAGFTSFEAQKPGGLAL
ncbi:MAG TPA: class I SAM-dependent methyltransferase [Solirubrobacterales bacterium]|nr:class I SAM-dependent methyltransferase [Solirubrobacterales bacterium]